MTAQNNTAKDSQSPPEECLSLARFLAAKKKHMMRRPHLCSRVKPVHLGDNFSIDIKCRIILRSWSNQWENWSEVLRPWSLKYLVWRKMYRKSYSFPKNIFQMSNSAKAFVLGLSYIFKGDITLWYSGWCSRRGGSQYRGRSPPLEVWPGKGQRMHYILAKMIAQILCELCPWYWFACVIKPECHV